MRSVVVGAGRWCAVLLALFMLGAAVAGPGIAGIEARDGDPEEQGFTAGITAKAVMGNASITVSLSGDFDSREARGFCEGGQVRDGTIEISDGKDSYTGTVTEGWVGVGSCIQGMSSIATINAQGVMDDEAFSEFSLVAIGKAGKGGELTDVIGIINTWTEFGPPEEMAELLESGLYLFSGAFEGKGKTAGFQTSSSGQTFLLSATGESRDEKVGLTVNGSMGMEGTGRHSWANFEAESSTVTIGSKEYTAKLKKFSVRQWGRDEGEIMLGGRVYDGDKTVGMVIARLRFFDMTEEFLSGGGEIDIEGRTLKLLVGGTNYRGTLEGTLKLSKP